MRRARLARIGQDRFEVEVMAPILKQSRARQAAIDADVAWRRAGQKAGA